MNGFEIHYDLSPGMTIVRVFGYDEPQTPQLRMYLSNYLSQMSMGIPIVDIWSCGEPIPWIRQSVQVNQRSKSRYLYVLSSASSFSDAQEEWFDTRCTLLGVCPSKEALDSYITHRHWTPEKALQRGCLSAYFCGDAANGYSVGLRGGNDGLLKDLMALLRSMEDG